jgi:hypothetical protein
MQIKKAPQNCPTIWVLNAPSALRIPTSLARPNDLAMDKLMKFMAAINRMIMPTMSKV